MIDCEISSYVVRKLSFSITLEKYNSGAFCTNILFAFLFKMKPSDLCVVRLLTVDDVSLLLTTVHLPRSLD